VRGQPDLDPRQCRAVQLGSARIGQRVGDQRDIGQRSLRSALVLVRVAVRPAQVPARRDRHHLVRRVVIDVGRDDLPERLLVGPVGPMRRVRDLVPLVHRRPHRAVRRHRQALAVADSPLDHPQVRVQASIRAPGTRAHTRAVQPDGTVSRRGVDSTPPPSPAGTTSFVVESADTEDGAADEASAAKDGTGAAHTAAAATAAAAASNASGKRWKGTVMRSLPSLVIRINKRTRRLRYRTALLHRRPHAHPASGRRRRPRTYSYAEVTLLGDS
jgi:hypothetical protein